MLLFGGVRVTRQNNIFNLIKNPDATVDDLKKLIDLAPHKLQEKKNNMNPLDQALLLNKDAMVKLLEEKGLTKTNDIKKKVTSSELFKSVYDNILNNGTVEDLKNILKDTDLSIIPKSKQVQFFLLVNKNLFSEKLKILLKANLDINLNILGDPLIFYVITKDIELLKIALEKGANPNTLANYNRMPVLYALLSDTLQNNDIILEKTKLLIQKGADIKYMTNGESYFNILHSKTRPLEFYKVFIDAGLDVDAQCNNTPVNMLIIAIGDKNRKELFDFFLENGANVNYKSKYNSTPLIIASSIMANMYYVEKLIEKGADVNALSDEDGTALIYAVNTVNSEEYIELIKYLLEKGADKTIKTKTGSSPESIARKKYNTHPEIYKKILLLLGVEVKEEKWKGSTKSDIEKYDIFFEYPYDWSCCPICLEYVERSEGCMYMKHDCSKTGHYYHKKLYDIYSYARFIGGPKEVEWCTICGRPTKLHKHWKLTEANNTTIVPAALNPEIQERLNRGDNLAFFDNANCIGFGGGGIEEKASRFRRLREYTLELQEDVDKRSHYEVMEELIEEVFNAPLVRNRKIKKILEDKRWNINVKEFPNKRNNTRNNTNHPNIPFDGTLPTKLDSKEYNCIIMADDDEGKEENPTFHFHHERNGGINHDGIFICQKDLARAIEIATKEFGVERFGKCWFSQCHANLHPEEIKGIVPDVLYEDYKKKFNKKMKQNGGRNTRKKQQGGNTQHILHKLNLSTAVCLPPNYTKDGKLRKN